MLVPAGSNRTSSLYSSRGADCNMWLICPREIPGSYCSSLNAYVKASSTAVCMVNSLLRREFDSDLVADRYANEGAAVRQKLIRLHLPTTRDLRHADERTTRSLCFLLNSARRRAFSSAPMSGQARTKCGFPQCKQLLLTR